MKLFLSKHGMEQQAEHNSDRIEPYSQKNEFAFSQHLLTFISTKMLSERGHDSMCWEIGTEHFCWPFVNEIVEFLQGNKTSNQDLEADLGRRWRSLQSPGNSSY